MEAIEALKKISDYITERRNVVYQEKAFAESHKFELEAQALLYKTDAYNDVIGEIHLFIRQLEHHLEQD